MKQDSMDEALSAEAVFNNASSTVVSNSLASASLNMKQEVPGMLSNVTNNEKAFNSHHSSDPLTVPPLQQQPPMAQQQSYYEPQEPSGTTSLSAFDDAEIEAINSVAARPNFPLNRYLFFYSFLLHHFLILYANSGMMRQGGGRGRGRGGRDFNPVPPAHINYICKRCHKPGHYVQNCPTNSDPTFDDGGFRNSDTATITMDKVLTVTFFFK